MQRADMTTAQLNADIQLTEREILIAQHAADLAVKKMWEEFYREGGKTMYRKFLPVIGLLAVGFMLGKGANWSRIFELMSK